MWHCVFGWVVPNVLTHHSVLVFWCKATQKEIPLARLHSVTQHHVTEVTSLQRHHCKNLTCCKSSLLYSTARAVNKTISCLYFISEHLVLLEDGTLVITSATLNTTGIYTCIAENIKGNDQRHFLVEVLGEYWAPQKWTHQFVTLVLRESGYSDCAVGWMSSEV